MHQSRFSASQLDVGPAVAGVVGVEGQPPPARRAVFVAGGVDGGLGQAGGAEFLPRPGAAEDAALDVVHPDEPLLGDVGLDRGLRPVGMADLDLPVLDVLDEPAGLEVGDDLLPGVEAVEPRVGAGVGVERAVGIQDVDDARSSSLWRSQTA